jgi:hypothetical protein
MKKTLILLLALLLTGCGTAAVTMVSGSPPPQTAAAGAVSAESLQYAVETSLLSDEARAEDGTLLASYSFELPHLTVLHADGTPVTAAETAAEHHALAVSDAFNQKFGKWAAAEEFPDFSRSAAEDLALSRELGTLWRPYTLELDCSVYQTDCLISVSGSYLSDTGGAHPNTWQLGWNFDLETGRFFDPDLLAGSMDLQASISEELLRQAQLPQEDGTIPAAQYWVDYEAILSNWSSYTVIFDEAGMAVIFSPYELAPYGAGPQVFRLSYEWLAPHLGDHGRSVLGISEK